jgi:hypothetical protein
VADILTINVASSVTAGSYTVKVTGSPLGATTSPTTITINVAAASPVAPAPANILGLDPTIFYSIVGAIVAVVIIGAVLVLRKPKS